MESEKIKENDISVTITKSYYEKLLQNAWVVERLKKHIKQLNKDEFHYRALSLLCGSLKDKLDIKDFGREING